MKIKQVTLTVEAMKVDHCNTEVANAIAAINGVKIASIVDLAKIEVVVAGQANILEVIEAIEKSGYYVMMTKFN